MKISYRLLLFLTSLLAVINGVSGQETSKELIEKRNKIEQEIEYTNRLIAETRKSKKVTLNELRLLNNRINKRNELVATLKKEILVLSNEIESGNIGLKRLSNELSELKSEYSKIIVFAYQHQTSYNKLIYLFSASDLNQAYQRMRYLDQIAEYIRDEASNIRRKEEKKKLEIEKLNRQREEKKQLLDEQNIQLSELEREQVRKDEITKKLSGKEKKLKSQLRAKQKESKKLDKKINEIIAREIEAAKARERSNNTAVEADLELSSSFVNNKGKLPWPVEKGIISEKFGVHNHPVLKNVKVKNNGLNIATSPHSDARSVFNGRVVSVATISSSNKAVIIRHGEYFTVYSNLDEVFVKAGDEVQTNQVVGKIHTNLEGKTELHFQVWKGKQIQNPAYWIHNK